MHMTDLSAGLSEREVEDRVRRGLSNADEGIRTKSEKQIILENTFTFFNILNFILAALVLLVGSFKNLLFMGVILSNTVIGSFQGIRAKRTIDKLSLITAPKANVLRDGKLRTVDIRDIVLDDITELKNGQQISADAVVREGEIEVNESLITGESDPITKRPGDKLLSGSFVVSGSCLAQVEHVGRENYASRIAAGAKFVKRAHSEILFSLNAIVKVIGIALIPIGLLLFGKQYFMLGDSLPDAVVSSVAAMIGMIPEGLVLLTSIVFAVSVIRLSKYKTLVQDLYCTESLARVDVLCLDKTGTITTGHMEVAEVKPERGYSEQDALVAAVTVAAANESDANETARAILACGTAYHAGLLGKWMIERLAQTIALSTEDRKEGTAACLEISNSFKYIVAPLFYRQCYHKNTSTALHTLYQHTAFMQIYNSLNQR